MLQNKLHVFVARFTVKYGRVTLGAWFKVFMSSCGTETANKMLIQN